MASEPKKRLQIIVPAYNEEDVIVKFYSTTSAACEQLLDKYDIGFLFVDDGSVDNTREELKRLHQKDDRVKFLSFSRNFGHQAALKAGLDHADADIVVMMDCDLQHPPGLIPQMVSAYEAGNDIVYTRRSGMQHSLLKSLFSNIFYRTINRLSDVDLILASSDFRLISRKVLHAIRQMGERDPFFRGLFRWAGYQYTVLPYEVGERAGGCHKYSLRKSFRLALSGITSFSTFPLSVGVYIGIISLLICLFLGIGIGVYSFWKREVHWPVLVALLVLFSSSVQIFIIGVMGEYLARMFLESKGRPHYLIDEAHGIDDPYRRVSESQVPHA